MRVPASGPVAPIRPSARERDWSLLRDALAAEEIEILGGPASGGWSADTVILEADGRRLVARFNPAEEGLFPAADLAVQVACLRAVRDAGLPAPEVVLDGSDGTHVGEAMFVMEFIAGMTPSDRPPHFATAGPLVDAAPAQQHTYYCDLVDRTAALQHVPAPPGLTVGPGLLQHVAHLNRLRLGRGSDLEVFDDVEAQLRETVPADTAPVGLLWGDPRPANTVVGPDFRVAAMLDWELAALGPAEMDIAWLWEMNVLRGDATRPDNRLLPGFLDRDETWDRWSSIAARQPVGTDWHHLFAAYKVALILDLNFRAQVRRGELAADHKLFRNNRALRRLTTLAAC